MSSLLCVPGSAAHAAKGRKRRPSVLERLRADEEEAAEKLLNERGKYKIRSKENPTHCKSVSVAEAQPQLMMRLSPPQSGFGDRICSYALAATVARLTNTIILTSWCTVSGGGLFGGSWRQPYVSNVLEHVAFPRELHFVTEAEYAASDLPMINLSAHTNVARWSQVPESAHGWLVSAGRINVSLHTFMSAHRVVCTQFRLIGPYASMLPMPPYAVVHARRGDKDMGHPGKAIGRFSSSDLQIKTVMARLLREGQWLRWLVASDDSKLLAKLQSMIRNGNNSNAQLVKMPHVNESTSRMQPIVEFFALARAHTIVQSVPGPSGWTAFSTAAAQINGAMLLACVPPGTVWQLLLAATPAANPDGGTRRLDRVRLLDQAPPSFGIDRILNCTNH